MAEAFVGEIRMLACNFPPRGWAFCNGQLLPISQNTALFSLLGTMYGGDGRSTFALPNLQAACAIGQGQGPGLTDRVVGESGGSATVSLLPTQIPAHAHTLMASSSALTNDPSGASLANVASGASAYRIPGATTSMAAEALSPAGGSQPHNNRPPYLALNFCIALQGIFPPRP